MYFRILLPTKIKLTAGFIKDVELIPELSQQAILTKDVTQINKLIKHPPLFSVSLPELFMLCKAYSIAGVENVQQLSDKHAGTVVIGTGEKPRYSETAVLGGGITLKNLFWDLKWAAVLGGRRYWEGGGIGRDTCMCRPYVYHVQQLSNMQVLPRWLITRPRRLFQQGKFPLAFLQVYCDIFSFPGQECAAPSYRPITSCNSSHTDTIEATLRALGHTRLTTELHFVYQRVGSLLLTRTH